VFIFQFPERVRVRLRARRSSSSGGRLGARLTGAAVGSERGRTYTVARWSRRGRVHAVRDPARSHGGACTLGMGGQQRAPCAARPTWSRGRAAMRRLGYVWPRQRGHIWAAAARLWGWATGGTHLCGRDSPWLGALHNAGNHPRGVAAASVGHVGTHSSRKRTGAARGRRGVVACAAGRRRGVGLRPLSHLCVDCGLLYILDLDELLAAGFYQAPVHGVPSDLFLHTHLASIRTLDTNRSKVEATFFLFPPASCSMKCLKILYQPYKFSFQIVS
jgi:hypothetical protein